MSEETNRSVGSAVEQGFGGPVSVTLTVEDGEITEVTAEGLRETDGFGSIALKMLPKEMVSAGSVEVDAITGATCTSDAIIAAAERAYTIATGGDDSLPDIMDINMAPGEYENTVRAFSRISKMKVIIKVNEKQILDIHVSENDENMSILSNAKRLLIPRIIQNQSVAVDAITGATGSSNGIKSAVALGLKQALAAGGSPSTAFRYFRQRPERKVGEIEELEYETLIIGMGGTGSAAAMRAAETQKKLGRPVSVLALDKAGKYGGTSSMTSEMMSINPLKFMKEHNYEVASIQNGTYKRQLEDTRLDKSVYVDKAQLKKEWIEYTCGDAKEELLDLMLDESGKALDWLVYEHGFFFGKPQLGVEPSAQYFLVYQYNGSFMDNKHVIAGYFDNIWHDYESLGGQYLLETEATELLIDYTGRVCGVKARRYDGHLYIIRAKAVVIATGGFAGNGDMTTELLQEDLFPLKGTWRLVGSYQNDGKMLQSALENGAGTYNISAMPITHIGGPRYYYHAFDTRIEKMDRPDAGTVSWDTVFKHKPGEAVIALDDIPMIMAISENVLAVNRFGKRFASEWCIGFLDPWRGGTEFYSLWTHDQIDQVRTSGFAFVQVGSFISQGGVPVGYPIERIHEVVEYAIKMGQAYKAVTIEELAKKLSIDPEALLSTVRKFNRYCETGVDEEFGKEAKYMRPIGEDKGPFYAFLGAPYCYSTAGGLDVNKKLQVLKKDGVTPIPGLYAAGTDCLGTLLSEKVPYVTYGGAAQGWAFTSGKVAGENAVLGVTVSG